MCRPPVTLGGTDACVAATRVSPLSSPAATVKILTPSEIVGRGGDERTRPRYADILRTVRTTTVLPVNRHAHRCPTTQYNVITTALINGVSPCTPPPFFYGFFFCCTRSRYDYIHCEPRGHGRPGKCIRRRRNRISVVISYTRTYYTRVIGFSF